MTTLITISLKLLVMEDDLDEGVETKDKLESILSAFRLDSLRPPTGSLQSTRTFKSHKAADMFTNIWSSVADARSIWHKDLLLVSRIKLCSNSNSYWLIRKWPSISNPWYHIHMKTETVLLWVFLLKNSQLLCLMLHMLSWSLFSL